MTGRCDDRSLLPTGRRAADGGEAMAVVGNGYVWFVEMWGAVEECRMALMEAHKRFCTREVMRWWLGEWATDERMAEVCALVDERCRCPALGGVPFGGWDLLPPPEKAPWRVREMLRAVTQVALSLGKRGVDCQALDKAYSAVYPHCRPIDAAKKGRRPNAKKTSNSEESAKGS